MAGIATTTGVRGRLGARRSGDVGGGIRMIMIMDVDTVQKRGWARGRENRVRTRTRRCPRAVLDLARMELEGLEIMGEVEGCACLEIWKLSDH